MIEEFLTNPEIFSSWRHVGGIQTLLSYGITPSLNPDSAEQVMLAKRFADELPAVHRQFLAKLRRSFSCGDFFFVHVGVRPGIPLDQQSDDDLFWIRDEFLECEESFGKVIVHGHTPVTDVEFHSNRIASKFGKPRTPGRFRSPWCQDVPWGASVAILSIESVGVVAARDGFDGFRY